MKTVERLQVELENLEEKIENVTAQFLTSNKLVKEMGWQRQDSAGAKELEQRKKTRAKLSRQITELDKEREDLILTLADLGAMPKKRSRHEILIDEGFKLITFKPDTSTKRGQFVQERINDSDIYLVYQRDDIVTVKTEWHVTKQEATELEKVTGCKYIQISHYMDDHDLWSEWIRTE